MRFQPLLPLFIAVVSCLVWTDALAQSSVTGRVRDAETGEPLAGVHVLVEGTTIGTVTDFDGHFVVEADGNLLVFSFLGYETRTLHAPNESHSLDVALTPREVDMRPIVVSASRVEERRAETPVAVASLSAREMQVKHPDQLAEVISTLPGVTVASLGNEQHVMSIRQPLSYGALYAYLEDGIPIRPTGVFNHNALIEINMAGVSRVEVVRGPSSSLFGPNAIGGAVNFITPEPAALPEASLQLRTDDQGYRRGDFHASAVRGNAGVWAGGYVARQRDGWAAHSDFDKVSLSLRADYRPAPTTRLTTTVSTNHLDTDTNGSLDSLSFHRRDYTSLQTFTHRAVHATRATTRISHVWNGHQSTDAAVFWRSNSVTQIPHYRLRISRDDPSFGRGERNVDGFHSLGATALHRIHLHPLSTRIIAGGSVERSPNSYRARFLSVVRDPESGRFLDYTLTDSLLTDYDVDLLTAGAFSQLELMPVARLKLVGSLRYDVIRYAFDNHLAPSAFSGAPDATDHFSRLSPRAGFTVDLSTAHGLYGNVSQGFLPPEISDLYRGVKVPHLVPATFNSAEIGGWSAFMDGRVHLDVSLYRMTGRNELVRVLQEDGSIESRNAGRTRHFGVEYALFIAPARAVTLRLTGTNAAHRFVRFQDGAVAFDGNEMDAAPDWMANAELTIRPPFVPGLRLGLEWDHLGPYFMDAQNSTEYAGYDLLTLRAGYETGPVEIWLNAYNLTDAHYATIATKRGGTYAYTPGGPRRFGAGVGYNF